MRARFPGPAAALAFAAAALVVAATLRYNTWTAGGADSSGYASQAELWLSGSLTVPLPLTAGAPWPQADWTFSPLGFRPATSPGAAVPTYPPGLPLTAAAIQAALGRSAIFVVVPVLAGVTVWATFLLGRALGGPACGAVAAAFIALSPIFLRQGTQLMSDVPAAAWWTLALVLAGRRPRPASAAAGLASGLAILTRPNLAHLALPVLGALLAHGPQGAGTAWRGTARDALRRTIVFVVAMFPAVAGVAWLNAHLYGSPLQSGYGSTADLYATANILPNVTRYLTWLAGSETPLLLAGVVGAVLPRRFVPAPAAARWPAVLLVLFTVAAYLPYAVFDDWWYTRFLLPALPAAFALAALALTAATRRLGPRSSAAALGAIVSIAGWNAIDRARELHTLDLARDERRYALIAEAVAAEAGPAPVLLAVQHSGSLRYYTGQPTLRWDFLPGTHLDQALAHVRSRGLTPYLVIDAWEAEAFRARFEAHGAVGRLDWPPRIELRTPTPVHLYRLDDREPFFSGARVPTRMLFPARR